MNTRLTIILVLASIILASVMHKNRIVKKQSTLEKLAKSLDGMRPYINSGSNLLVQNKSASFELPFMTRIILAPAHTTIDDPHDTILTIYNKDNIVADSIETKLIWQYTDEAYHYTLTTKL